MLTGRRYRISHPTFMSTVSSTAPFPKVLGLSSTISSAIQSVHVPRTLPIVDSTTWERAPAPKPLVVPPPNSAAPPSTLGKNERRSNPKMKRLHVHSQDQTYSPGYIARMWAHYSTMIEGPPIVHRIVHRVSKVFRNQSQPHSHTLRTLPLLCQSTAPGHNAQHHSPP